MTIFQANTYSEALKRNVPYHVVLPNDVPEMFRANNPHYDRPMKSLYLYHGYAGNSLDWLTGTQAQDVAGRYNLAIILPSGENSFYLNGQGSGSAYETYVGEELVDYITKTFGLSRKKEDIFVGGLSMGGFGALHTGLKFPETFSKIIALSSAIIVHEIATLEPGTDNGMADYDYYVKVFGDLKALPTSQNNPEVLLQELKAAGKDIPEIYLACGTEDFLIERNRQFNQFLVEHEAPVTYVESPGQHDWKFWNEHLERGVKWLFGESL